MPTLTRRATLAGNPIGHSITIVNVVLTTFAIILVCIRSYARAWLIKSWGRDDTCVIIALIGSIGVSVSLGVANFNGLGKKVINVLDSELVNVRKAAYCLQIFYTISVSFTKLALLFLVLRLTPSPRMRYTAYFVILVIVVYTIVALGIGTFLCSPIPVFFYFTLPDIITKDHAESLPKNLVYVQQLAEGKAKCFDLGWQQFIAPVINTLTDITVWIMPMSLVWSLHIPRRQKIGLYCVFGIGLICCGASVFRIAAVGWFVSGDDPTNEGYALGLCSVIEANLGLFCSCIPALKPVIIKILPEAWSGVVKSTHGSGDHALAAIPSPAPKRRIPDPIDEGLSTNNSSNSTIPLDSIQIQLQPQVGGRDSNIIYLPESEFSKSKQKRKGKQKVRQSSQEVNASADWSANEFVTSTGNDDIPPQKIANTMDIVHRLDHDRSFDSYGGGEGGVITNLTLRDTLDINALPTASYTHTSSTEQLGGAAAPLGGHESETR